MVAERRARAGPLRSTVSQSSPHTAFRSQRRIEMAWTKAGGASAAGPSRPITPVTVNPPSSTETRRSPKKKTDTAVESSPLGAAGSATAGQASSSAYQDQGRRHLRQRSVQTPRGELNEDPFSDRAAAAPTSSSKPTRSATMPTPIVTAGLPHAAMMGSADPFADNDTEASIAHNMRGDRAEWVSRVQSEDTVEFKS